MSGGEYDGETQMFRTTCHVDYNRLRAYRWLAEQGRLADDAPTCWDSCGQFARDMYVLGMTARWVGDDDAAAA